MKQFESFVLDEQNECLWHNGEQIALPPRVFAVLSYLVENPGRLISHDELLDKLWPDTYVQPQILRTYMLELRKILGDDARLPRFIRSHPKRGYVFLAAVEETSSSKPSTAAARPASTLLGRDKELSELCTHVEQLSSGARQIVFISGDAGMGKTALVDAFHNEWAESHHIAIARGQCVQGIGTREQYYPILEALAHLCASHDSERACRILAKIAPEWLPIPARETGSHHNEHTGSASNLCAALEELAADKPLLLILEDIHWADEATLDVLSALARRRVPAQLMILATFSAHHTGAEHPLRRLKQDLRMRRLCTELALTPLTRTQVTELLRRRLEQDDLPPDLDSFVHQHAEGNPLFVLAILDHLIKERFLTRTTSAHWEQRTPLHTMDAGIPEELTQMIEVELERLTPAEQRLLEAASLVSVAFPAWAVAAALEEDIAETEDACDSLSRRVSFIRRAGHDELPDGTRSAFYVFAHGLYREVLYQRMPAARRARRHTRVAERLCSLFAGREFDVAHEIAMHFEAAGEWLRAIAVLRAAACVAQQRNSTASAAELLDRALLIATNLRAEEQEKIATEISTQLLSPHIEPHDKVNQSPKHPTKA